MMNFNEVHVTTNEVTKVMEFETKIDELLFRGQVRRLMEAQLERYDVMPLEELDKELTDDIRDFAEQGLYEFSNIAREVRENIRVNKTRDLLRYKIYVHTRFEEVYEGFKRHMNIK